MTKVVIIGSGIIGSSIAYQLSHYPQLEITLVDGNNPGTGSTGAALGILMGVISHKTKGRAWRLREASLKRYTTLIPELEELTKLTIPHNSHGIVKLLFAPEQISKYQKLSKKRAEQGYKLDIWDADRLKANCPEVDNPSVIGAVYSPDDRQINPTSLTKTLVKASVLKGVQCLFGENVIKIDDHQNNSSPEVHLTNRSIEADWVILATALGTSNLIQPLGCDLKIKPVLGQALLIQHHNWQHNSDFNPVITGDDVHIAPMKNNEFWLGATVEFPTDEIPLIPDEDLLTDLHQKALSFCPNLATAPIMLSWTGKRPRPDGKPAPIIERLENHPQIVLATGHYRNGVLLAPATAESVAAMIINS